MDEAIKKLNAFKDWVNDTQPYWIDTDKIDTCIELLESDKTAKEFGEAQ